MWVARNKNNTLCIFYHKPWREYDSCWGGYTNNQMVIPETLFPELTWKDEPIEVKLVSKSIDEKEVSHFCDEYLAYEHIFSLETLEKVRKAYKAAYSKAING